MTDTIVLDSSALIAILKKEDDAALLMTRWLDADESMVCTATLLECYLVVSSIKSTIKYEELLALLQRMGTSTMPFDAHLLHIATDAHKRFGRGKHKAKLNFGDCMSYALAKYHDVPLLAKGTDFRHTDVELAA